MRDKLDLLRVMLPEALMLLIAAALFLWALCLPFAAVASEAYTADEAALMRAYERGEIVRLHILADGDDAESQRVKLAVRDAIIDAFGEMLQREGAESADAAYLALQQNAEAIEGAALICARENGFAGSVLAEAGRLWLPEKSYGRARLPEGEYRALRVTLGGGEGRNWWCVLFPSLCLSIAGEGEPSESAPQIVWDTAHIWRLWTALPI